MDLGDIKIRNRSISRVYHKNEVVSPKPATKGLVAWYDFKGRSNHDLNKGIVSDLSGSNQNMRLRNFSYEVGSGYENGLENIDRNLIKDSKNGIFLRANNTSLNPIELAEEDEYSSVRIVYPAVALSTYTSYFFDLEDTYDGYISVSVDINPETDCSIGFTPNELDGRFFCEAGKWTRIEYTYKPTDNRVRGLYSDDIEIGKWIHFKNYKTEKGDPTPWTPAPEDKEFNEWFGYADYLRFDGVDDFLSGNVSTNSKSYSLFTTFNVKENKRNHTFYAEETLKVDFYGSKINFLTNLTTETFQNVTFGSFLDSVNTWGVVCDGNSYEFWLNGDLKERHDAVITDKNFYFSSIGLYTPDGRPNIHLYDVKLYDRALTTNEITYNYDVDKSRWNI